MAKRVGGDGTSASSPKRRSANDNTGRAAPFDLSYEGCGADASKQGRSKIVEFFSRWEVQQRAHCDRSDVEHRNSRLHKTHK
jgi:hypothetical protein